MLVLNILLPKHYLKIRQVFIFPTVSLDKLVETSAGVCRCWSSHRTASPECRGFLVDIGALSESYTTPLSVPRDSEKSIKNLCRLYAESQQKVKQVNS